MTGKHILAEFWECECAQELLTSTEPLLSLLVDAVHTSGLTIVGHAAHEFNEYDGADVAEQQICGVTLTLLLAESHLCLHTWGEYKTVTLDVYVCNVTHDNSRKADALYEACLQVFKPKQHHVNSLSRQHQIPNNLQH